ncbi:MAG: SUMF1/EgtB/PvdO family nonheme iron enzyme [Treponema sp.]|nr:SUMF1/EgtB/PvdO family nonheme iron enzyme [Treponema sp.]
MGCAGGAKQAGSGSITLDQAIQAAAENIENNVQAGQKIAVLNFSSPSIPFSVYVIEELSEQLVNGKKLVVVDRRDLDLIRQEEDFQMSGEVSDESAQAIGKKLGAQLIISGSLTPMGGVYRFRIRTLNVESATIVASSSADLSAGETRISSLLTETPVSNTPAAQPAPVSATVPTPAPASATVTPTATTARSVPHGFALINGGTFTMGSPADEPERDDDETQRHVTVSSFLMRRHEVTQAEYQEVMGKNPSSFKGDNLPVDSVNWYDAIEYCNKRSQNEGLTPAYTIDGVNVRWDRDANGYRLPTEAEWEYACRAGTTTPFSTGNNITANQANYNGNYPYNNNAKGENRQRTTPVGTFAPNPWGLHDMHGNVFEWCWDWYGDYPGMAQTDPAGVSFGTSRVVRGGSWNNSAGGARSALRNIITPSFRYAFVGIRLVRNAQ